jgi:hypothetical protein
MLADLVQANIEADPSRAGLLQGVAGAVNIRVRDADVEVGLEFRDGRLYVRAAPFPKARLMIDTDADTLMGMPAVPLRFGLPDVFTPEGRGVVRKMLSGRLHVGGMVRGLRLMMRLERLLSVA